MGAMFVRDELGRRTRVIPVRPQVLVECIVHESEQLFARDLSLGEDVQRRPPSRFRALGTDVEHEQTSCVDPSWFESYRSNNKPMTVAIHIPAMLLDREFHFRFGHRHLPVFAAAAPGHSHTGFGCVSAEKDVGEGEHR